MIPVVKRNQAEEIRFALGRSSVGRVLVASSDKGVVAISVGEDPDELVDELLRLFPAAHVVSGDRQDRDLVNRVAAYIENPRSELDLPLDLRGTAFQRKVWRAVREIPFGTTSTYAEVARKIGAPRAMRAVGSACANCRLAFVIPCHRVLRSDGSCSAGRERQQFLIDRERAAEAKAPQKFRRDDG